MLLQEQAAEDAVQETFLRAYKARHRFDAHKASPKTWLYQIALNYCRSQLRRKQWSVLGWFNHQAELERLPADGLNLENKLIQSESHQLLWHAVQKLSQPLKEVVLLHYYLDIPAVDIAQTLNCPEGTVYSRLYNARKRLAKVLAEQGLTALTLDVPHV